MGGQHTLEGRLGAREHGLQRRLQALLKSAGETPSGELSEVTGQLADAERELADVRALLAELREQTFS